MHMDKVHNWNKVKVILNFKHTIYPYLTDPFFYIYNAAKCMYMIFSAVVFLTFVYIKCIKGSNRLMNDKSRKQSNQDKEKQDHYG